MSLADKAAAKMKLLEMKTVENHLFHPLRGKAPLNSNWPLSNPDQKTLLSWIEAGHGIGWIQGLTAAIDFDKKELARDFWRRHGPFRCAIQESPRGFHLIFANPRKVGNAVNIMPNVDVRGCSGYLVFYSNFVKGFDTTDPQKLDAFPEHLIPRKRRFDRKAIWDVRAYVSKIESFEGQNGSAGLVRAAATCQSGGLSQAEATIVLLGWNRGSTVSPPWSEKELARAITRIYEKNE